LFGQGLSDEARGAGDENLHMVSVNREPPLIVPESCVA